MTAKERYDAARAEHLAAAARLAEAKALLVKIEHDVADALAERRRAFAAFMNSDEA